MTPPSKKDYYVYAYIRSEGSEAGQAGTPYYIGKGKEDRAWDIKRHTTRPPVDPDRVKIIAGRLNNRDALQLEMFLIFIHGRLDKGTGILRNRTDGGEGIGRSHTKEQRDHLSEIMKIKWADPIFRSKRVASLKGVGLGRKCGEGMRKRLSERGCSEATRKKMSEKRKGKKLGPMSEETKRKLSESYWSKPRIPGGCFRKNTKLTRTTNREII